MTVEREGLDGTCSDQIFPKAEISDSAILTELPIRNGLPEENYSVNEVEENEKEHCQ
jgi:hypothetical protein